jgi:hypothetical protein
LAQRCPIWWKGFQRSSLGWNSGWAGLNFTQNVQKWWRESSRLLTWLDLRIIIRKHDSKMYKLIKVSSLAWAWGSSDKDCTPRSPNISICWKRIFQNPFLDGVAGMMEIIRSELYLTISGRDPSVLGPFWQLKFKKLTKTSVFMWALSPSDFTSVWGAQGHPLPIDMRVITCGIVRASAVNRDAWFGLTLRPEKYASRRNMFGFRPASTLTLPATKG